MSESFSAQVLLVGENQTPDVYPEVYLIDMNDSWLSLSFDDGSAISFNRDQVIYFITYPYVEENE